MAPSLTRIKQLLKSAAFDPRKPGSMRVVVEMNDPTYCIKKAVELLLNASDDDDLRQAVSLVTLARAQLGSTETQKTR